MHMFDVNNRKVMSFDQFLGNSDNVKKVETGASADIQKAAMSVLKTGPGTYEKDYQAPKIEHGTEHPIVKRTLAGLKTGEAGYSQNMSTVKAVNIHENATHDVTEIRTQEEFKKFSKSLGVRPDWHEPDEQGVSAFIEGDQLDNAGGGPPEFTVLITKHREVVGRINLASLLAMAAGTWDDANV